MKPEMMTEFTEINHWPARTFVFRIYGTLTLTLTHKWFIYVLVIKQRSVRTIIKINFNFNTRMTRTLFYMPFFLFFFLPRSFSSAVWTIRMNSLYKITHQQKKNNVFFIICSEALKIEWVFCMWIHHDE